MKVFYARVSTVDQNEARQIKSAEEVGAEKIFLDKKSGKNADREELKKMLDFIRQDDVVITSDISRIARNTRDLLNIVEKINNKGAEFISLKENIDTTTAQGKFMLTVFGAMAELERESILQRQREGIECARAQGKYQGKPKMKIDENEFKRLCKEWRAGDRTAVSIMRQLNISSQTFYRRVKEYNL